MTSDLRNDDQTRSQVSHRNPVSPNAALDSMLSSGQPWKIIAGATVGTPILTTMLLARGLRSQGDSVSPYILGGVFIAATVFGFLIGITVVGFRHHKALRQAGRRVPWLLRLLFDGQPLKLMFVGLPLLFVLAIACGILMA